MLKMSIFQLGMVVVALCLTTQVAAQNNTTTANGNVTSSLNTTMSPGTYGSSTNTTSPTGAGVPLQAGTVALFAPLLVVLHRYC